MWALIQNDQIIETTNSLRQKLPNVSFAGGVVPDSYQGWEKVQRSIPEPKFYEGVGDESVVLVSGVPTTQFEYRSRYEDMTLEEAKVWASNYVAGVRYQYEVSGCSVQVTGIGDALNIQTSAQSQSKLISARVLAKEDAGRSFGWKTIDGFQPLAADQMIEVADQVIAFIENCFSNEAAHLLAINSAVSSADLEALAFDGWPQNSLYGG